MAHVPPYVAVVGPGEAADAQARSAEAVGQGLARHGAVLLTGGHGGVMAAACRGAFQAGGLTVGLLPDADRSAGNQWLTVALATGLGELRNGLIVRAADVLIAVGGAYGTLSEVALALKTGVPVVGLESWEIEGMQTVTSPQQAVARALELAASGAPR